MNVCALVPGCQGRSQGVRVCNRQSAGVKAQVGSNDGSRALVLRVSRCYVHLEPVGCQGAKVWKLLLPLCISCHTCSKCVTSHSKQGVVSFEQTLCPCVRTRSITLLYLSVYINICKQIQIDKSYIYIYLNISIYIYLNVYRMHICVYYCIFTFFSLLGL